MGWYGFMFVAAIALQTGLSLWLDWRQARFVKAHRAKVPEAFADQVPLSDHQKAADYTMARLQAGVLELFAAAALALLWTFGGGIAFVDSAVARLALHPLAHGTVVVLSVPIAASVISLPLALYSTFGIERRFGFNRTTLGIFIADRIKGLLIALLLGVPMVMLALWLMRAAGSWWWLWLWVALNAFQFFMTWAAPVLIMPLFNKFTPLQDEALRGRIERLIERCGFSTKGVFVMDGSKRSSHGNAFFGGLGRSKRVVFFDTLLAVLKPVEVEAVLAHELGHFRKKHIQKQILFTLVLSLALTAALGWLARQPQFYSQLGVAAPSDHAALILFVLAAPAYTFLLTPLVAYFSRRHEYEADAFAAQNADAPALAAGLVKLHRDNASTLTPDPLYAAFYYSHPPALQRIQALQAAGQAAPAVT